MFATKDRGHSFIGLAIMGLVAAVLIFSEISHSAALESLPAKQAGVDDGKPPAVQKLVRDGIAIEFQVFPDESVGKLQEGGYADVEFRISDAETGTPVKGIYPAVWLDIAKPWENPEQESTISCRERVETYMQGIVGVRPLVDLNSYYVLVMNQDETISVIDPIIGVAGITKLYAKINLLAPGAEWAKMRDEKTMFVSMPAENKVAVIDLTTFKVTSNIDAGEAPVRIALQPDEKYLWVANNRDGTDMGGVTIIDVGKQQRAGFVETGPGHHELAFSHDSRHAYVTNRDSGTIAVIDTASLKKIETIDIGEQVIGIAYSDKSEALYATDGKTGRISVIDAGSHRIVKRIDVKPGVGPVGITQKGRWMIAANSFEDVVYAVDVSTNELVHTIGVERKPYQIAFSRAFVYVRSMGSERVGMIEINHLNKMDKVPVASCAAGAGAPGKTAGLSLAPAIASITSTRSKASKVAAIILWRSSFRDTSTRQNRASPPFATISSQTFSPARSSISATTTRAPSLANRCAQARPIPLPAPVTITTRSV